MVKHSFHIILFRKNIRPLKPENKNICADIAWTDVLIDTNTGDHFEITCRFQNPNMQETGALADGRVGRSAGRTAGGPSHPVSAKDKKGC